MTTVSVCHCGARWNWLAEKLTDACDEPCRFVMGKSGEGKPPIPTAEFIAGCRWFCGEQGHHPSGLKPNRRCLRCGEQI